MIGEALALGAHDRQLGAAVIVNADLLALQRLAMALPHRTEPELAQRMALMASTRSGKAFE